MHKSSFKSVKGAPFLKSFAKVFIYDEERKRVRWTRQRALGENCILLRQLQCCIFLATNWLLTRVLFNEKFIDQFFAERIDEKPLTSSWPNELKLQEIETDEKDLNKDEDYKEDEYYDDEDDNDDDDDDDEDDDEYFDDDDYEDEEEDWIDDEDDDYYEDDEDQNSDKVSRYIKTFSECCFLSIDIVYLSITKILLVK